MKRAAFTLIELIMVVVLIGILSGVAMISLRSQETVALSAAAQKVVVDLNYARGSALSTAFWYGVSFEADPANTYTVYLASNEVVVADPSNLGKPLEVNLAALFNGVSIQSVTLAGSNRVFFCPLGEAYEAKDGNQLANDGEIVLAYGNQTKSVFIDHNSGMISLQPVVAGTGEGEGEGAGEGGGGGGGGCGAH
ncbi:hypothetical protein COT42_08990 [Candidatus Saganbacteria bacterium CG08_land_8_20_14_0_20_45_16]|uniref:Prepilin-type N-terminal cleavage/methylation domain-containing protein n=1 Tax=Candidatus Saganbacteria bacterium CG08_land_8_20_14_0_20_45_16 TaxID=2014293 RepID=A0A2H0XT54_UNCSA|nr:MAG: hypothetical protein COT42_08990 [Candidatus Saganbacteria bacterium CG08_land_8_20_14_0_20_45_16]